MRVYKSRSFTDVVQVTGDFRPTVLREDGDDMSALFVCARPTAVVSSIPDRSASRRAMAKSSR